MLRSDRIILRKMVGYCDDIAAILQSFDADYQRYTAEKVYQYACDMCIIQLGELASRLSDACIGASPELPWKYVRAMRNLFAHDYQSARLDMVWDTLTNDIPSFRSQLAALLEEENLTD